MKLLKKIGIFLLLIVVIGIVYVFYAARSLDVEKLSDNLFVLRGLGGNVTVINTSVGAVIVDSMTFPMQGKIIQSKVKDLTDSDVVMIINTHYHFDHARGNPGFDPNTRVVSTQRTLSHLTVLDASFWEGDAVKLLPNETFDQEYRIQLGDTSLLVIHPGRGHTDGDLAVLIEAEKTLVMGDLFVHQKYPYIDLEAGGSVQEWPETIESLMPLDFTRVIPGHGETTDRLGLQKFQRFMSQLQTIGRIALADDLSLEDTLATTRLTADKGFTGFRLGGVPLGSGRKSVLTKTWDEVNNNFKLKNKEIQPSN